MIGWLIVALLVMAFFNIIGIFICANVCDNYMKERNTYRDKWIRATEEYKDHLEWANSDLKDQLEDLKEEKDNASNP